MNTQRHATGISAITKEEVEMLDINISSLVTAVEVMGSGEITHYSINKDGMNSGFDFELVTDVKRFVKNPVIAYSGAGKPAHFKDVFCEALRDVALCAGMII